MRRKFSVFLVLILFLLVASGCGTNFSRDTYRALAIQAHAYDAGMKAAADLHKAGKIDDAEKEKIIQAAKGYKDAYDTAVDKMIEYEKAPPTEQDAAMRQAEIAAEVLAKLFGNLQDILSPLGVKLIKP